MNYIVIDLEFNQPFDFPNGDKTTLEKNCLFEIIQIGAIKMDENLKIIETSDFLIKPIVYPRLHPYVKKITGLDMDILDNCKIFPEIYTDFLNFIGSEQYIFCVWGSADIKALYTNVVFHKLDFFKLCASYINVQALASKKLNKPEGINIGLRNAVEGFNIDIDASFHYALNDAMYTAKIFKLIEWNAANIQNFKLPIPQQKKYMLNSVLFYKALEKELGRKLTKNEKRIYKKVYYMGRSKQFDIASSK